MLQQHCNNLTKLDAIANIAKAGEHAIPGSFNIAECKRRSGDFEGAMSVIEAIEKSEFSADEQTKLAIERHRKKLIFRDARPIDDCQVSNVNQFSVIMPTATTAAPQPELPSVFIRGWNFASAMARYAASGFKRSSVDLLETRLAQCQACPELENDHCKLCGCACVAENILLNKLALESEKCPLGKW
jgi:hypothetical protein